jgi:hypothetical protein
MTMGAMQESEDYYSPPGSTRRPLGSIVQMTNVTLSADRKGIQFCKAMERFPEQK